jgi:ABC-2 type transport system ATP-binding protein
MVEVDHLSKRYREVHAIEDLSFSVRRGEILGFLGPNGAGKTTTLRILAGFIYPTGGTAIIDRFDILKDPIEVKKRIGYLPENPPLYSHMTVDEFLLFNARLRTMRPSEIDRRITGVKERFAIESVCSRRIGTLSKGYRQRVAFAGILIHDPDLLLLDEPTIGLDPKQIIDVRNLIKELGGDHTVILSTHILPEVSMVCDRIVIIDRGRLVAVDTPVNLTTRLEGGLVVELEIRGDASVVERGLSRFDAIESVKRTGSEDEGKVRFQIELSKSHGGTGEIAAFIVHQGWELLEMRKLDVSLEEIFLRLTTDDTEQ